MPRRNEPLNAQGYPESWENTWFRPGEPGGYPSPAALQRGMRLLIQFTSKGGDDLGTQENVTSSSLSTSCPPVAPASPSQPLTTLSPTSYQAPRGSTSNAPAPTPEIANVTPLR